MNLTYEYFTNNVEEKLATKVKETYLKYPAEQRGGPLFFKIMIDILQKSSSEAAQYLISTVKGINISNYDGENIEQVVSLIRGATSRLDNLFDGKGDSLIPKDFDEDLIRIFQTTSVPEFNDLFAQLSRNSTIDAFKAGTTMGNAGQLSIPEILRFAETQYRKFYRSGQWSGVNTKLTETSFLAAEKAKCFNCGGDHHLTECTIVKNADRIKANYKLFMKKKRKDSAASASDKKKNTNSKFSPPTAAEKANNHRRIIDGKEHFYFWKTKRWKPVKNNDRGKKFSSPQSKSTNVAEATNEEVTSPSLSDINRNKRAEEQLLHLKSVLLAQLEHL